MNRAMRVANGLRGRGIDPRMLMLLHQHMGRFQIQPQGGVPHGFGPGGAVTGGGTPDGGPYRPPIVPLGPPVNNPNDTGNVSPDALQAALAQVTAGGVGQQSGGGQMVPGSIPGVNPFGNGPLDSGYNPAQFQRLTGNTNQAAEDWYGHHPGAVAAGHIPGWVQQQMASRMSGIANSVHQDGVEGAHHRARQLAQMIVGQRGGRNLRQSLRRFSPPAAPPQMAPPPNSYS